MKPGWATSPTSEPVKGSCTWRSSWTWRPAELLVSLWHHTSKTSLATDALREAIGTRGGQMRGVVFHTDRGSPIHLEGHRSALQGLWHRTVGGTDRGVLGQRRRRIVSRHPQDRTRQPKQLPEPPPRPPIDPVLDPSLVQPPPASFHDRTSATERMGGQLLPSHGRINQVSSTWGELHTVVRSPYHCALFDTG